MFFNIYNHSHNLESQYIQVGIIIKWRTHIEILGISLIELHKSVSVYREQKKAFKVLLSLRRTKYF